MKVIASKLFSRRVQQPPLVPCPIPSALPPRCRRLPTEDACDSLAEGLVSGREWSGAHWASMQHRPEEPAGRGRPSSEGCQELVCRYSGSCCLWGKTLKLALCILLITLRISSLPSRLASTFAQQCFPGPPPQSASAHILASGPAARGADWKHLRVFSISTSALSSVTSVNPEQPPISLRSQ